MESLRDFTGAGDIGWRQPSTLKLVSKKRRPVYSISDCLNFCRIVVASESESDHDLRNQFFSEASLIPM